MSLNRLVSKYISSAEEVFSKMKVAEPQSLPDLHKVGQIVDYAKAYLEDSKYYRHKKMFEVSLTSIAYCEGLLDALRLMGTVKFEWPAKMKMSKREE